MTKVSAWRSRFFAALRMTRLRGRVAKRTNVMWSDLAILTDYDCTL
jgi:hypothetical protein